MFLTQAADSIRSPLSSIFGTGQNHLENELPTREDILDIALGLLESGSAEAADRLLTAALIESPDDEDLWLAAGICRLKRGATRSAAAAFQMGAWLGDDLVYDEILSLLDEIRQ